MKPITRYYLYYKSETPFCNPRFWFYMAKTTYKMVEFMGVSHDLPLGPVKMVREELES